MKTCKKQRIIFLVGFFCLLYCGFSCKIGPKYVRPVYPMDSTFRFALNSDTLSIADSSWATLFNDTILRNLIETGLRNNLNIQMTYEKIYQAKLNYKIARVQMWPMLNLTAGAEKERTENPLGKGMVTSDWDMNVGGSLSWELDFFGKLRSMSDASKAQFLATVAAQQALCISLISEIAQTYFSLIEAHEILKITQSNVLTLEESLRLVELQLMAGTTTGMTVAQAKSELASMRMQLPGFEQNIGTLENNLQLLLGSLPKSISEYGILTEQMNIPEVPGIGVPSQLLNRRPDIIQAEQDLVAANAKIGVAKANLFPSITISATGGYYKVGDGLGFSLLGNLVTPIFGEGRLINAYKQSKSSKIEMLINYQSVIYSAINEVSNAILTLGKSRQKEQSTQVFLDEAKIEFDLSNQLYINGMANYLDVLTAQRNYFSAKISMCESRTSVLQNYVTLYKALGGGWK